LGGGTNQARRIDALVVEDEPLVVRAIRRVLGPAFRVRHVDTTARAIRALGEERAPSLVLIDVRLGGDETAGLEILRHAAAVNVPRALVTALDDVRIRHESAQHGALFIPKPFTREDFETLVKWAEAVHRRGPGLHEIVEERARAWKLSPTQTRIVHALVSSDGDRKALAAALGISTNTLRNHVRLLLARANFDRVSDLVLALRTGAPLVFHPGAEHQGMVRSD
jgi:FixJ family two-component response regulator